MNDKAYQNISTPIADVLVSWENKVWSLHSPNGKVSRTSPDGYPTTDDCVKFATDLLMKENKSEQETFKFSPLELMGEKCV